MEIHKQTKWLCEHARQLERFSGQCVLVNVLEDTISKHESLSRVLKTVHRAAPGEQRPFVFHVPSKRELATTVFGTSR
jgi:hypothetical protein